MAASCSASELQLRTRRLGLCEPNNIWKLRQNLGRLRRRGRLNQRLPRMRWVQRLGDDRLPGMKRIGAATGRNLRSVISGHGLWRLRRGQDGRENPSRDRTTSTPYALKEFRGVMAECSRSAEETGPGAPGKATAAANANFGEALLDPAIAKDMARRRNFFRRDWPAEQNQNAGCELLAPPNPRNCELRGAWRLVRTGPKRANPCPTCT